MTDTPKTETAIQSPAPAADGATQPTPKPKPNETGGPKGLEPTRYGDWEKGGRCIDF